MISVVLSWIIILLPTYIIGYGVGHALNKRDQSKCWSTDLYIAIGLCFLTVYAQVFSLFYKVGTLACLVLSIITLLFLLFDLKQGLMGTLKFRKDGMNGIILVLLFWGALATIYYTSLSPQHYDTALYHAQAIRWVEEYGVVKGLGNLHFRFAYNSAFIPLQALFSLKWLVSQSMHTVNGFVACEMLWYAIGTNRFLTKEKPVQTSDFLKLAVIIYIVMNRSMLSSPSTDTMALLLVGYIFIKCMEFIENDIQDTRARITLVILVAWGVTLKLSVAPMAMLVLYPVWLIYKNQKWRSEGSLLIAGILTVALPWMIRSVLISGYLIYPYSVIDLFQVDWKMPEAVLNYDKIEIMVWGRALKDTSLYNMKLWEWFPIWFRSNSTIFNIIFILAVAAMLVLLFHMVSAVKLKENIRAFIYVNAITGFIFWFATAPLMRYGLIYSFILIALAIGAYSEKHAMKFANGLFLMVMLPVMVLYLDVFYSQHLWVRQADYEQRDNVEKEVDGVKVWILANGDQIGYAVFPSTPYEKMLSVIELRRDSVKDGFRIKEEWKNRVIRGDGETR